MHARWFLPVVFLLAGCFAPTHPDEAATSPIVPWIPPLPGFEQDHDHLNPALHEFSANIHAIAYHNLVPGTDGSQASARGNWLTSEVIVRGDRAIVGYIGAPWILAVVDISDAAAPKLLGTLKTSAAWGMDVAVSDDGEFAFISVYNGAVGTLFTPDYLVKNAQVPDGPAAPGVLVADLRDPTNPTVSSFFPMHGLGPHTAVYHRYPDASEYIFANKAEGGIPGNGVVILKVTPTPNGGRALELVSTFVLDDKLVAADFPHDVDVQEHPVTGRTLLYAAYWDQGLVTVDVTDPAKPVLVSQFTAYPAGEEIQLHDVHPFPRLVDGRAYTFTAPEIPAGATTGHLRVYDTTDPVKPTLVGSWMLPNEYGVDQPFLFSTHNFQFLPDGRVALAHGHAGVWIVDWLGPGGEAAPDSSWMKAPVGVAYFVPSATGAKPPAWDPVAGVPWFWGTAVDERGLVWASDVASGLYGLHDPASAEA